MGSFFKKSRSSDEEDSSSESLDGFYGPKKGSVDF